MIMLIRMMRSVCLTDAAEVSLRVDRDFLFENFSAPVLGPFIRACTRAQTLHLNGKKNMLMLPVLKQLTVIHPRQRDFDNAFFSVSGTWNFHQYLQDVIMELKPGSSTEKIYCLGQNLLENQKQKLKTVHLLHTDFDVATLEGYCMMFCAGLDANRK